MWIETVQTLDAEYVRATCSNLILQKESVAYYQESAIAHSQARLKYLAMEIMAA